MFWYEEEVKRLEKANGLLNQDPRMVFYGSSSIRLWSSLSEDFTNHNPLNRGFGGSTLAACVWFFNRIITNTHPSSFIIYAGDNDLGDNRHPEEVYIYFKQLIAQIRKQYGNIPVGYISIKPSLNRFNILDRIRFCNKIIASEIEQMNDNTCFINIYDKMLDNTGYPRKELFQKEGLHLNEKGYSLWKETVLEYIADGRMKL